MAESDTRAHVLVVDDDPAVGMVLGALLQQGGFRATSVPSGARAIEVLAAEPIDAVITDLRMPGMDGMQLLAHVIRTLPDVPVLLISAHATVPDAVEAMKIGAVDFVQKPFEIEEMELKIEKAIELRHLKHQVEYLRHAQQEGAVVDVSGSMPKSFVLTDFPDDTVYITQISTAAIRNRAAKFDMGQ